MGSGAPGACALVDSWTLCIHRLLLNFFKIKEFLDHVRNCVNEPFWILNSLGVTGQMNHSKGQAPAKKSASHKNITIRIQQFQTGWRTGSWSVLKWSISGISHMDHGNAVVWVPLSLKENGVTWLTLPQNSTSNLGNFPVFFVYPLHQ